MQITSDIQLSLDKLTALLEPYTEMGLVNFFKNKDKNDIMPLLSLMSSNKNFIKLKQAVAKYLYSTTVSRMNATQLKSWIDTLTASKEQHVRFGTISFIEELLPIYEKRLANQQSFFVGRSKEEGLAEFEKNAEIANTLKNYIQKKDEITAQASDDVQETEVSTDSFDPERIAGEISSKLNKWLGINPDVKVLSPEFGAVFYYIIGPYLKSIKVDKHSSFHHIAEAIVDGAMQVLSRKFPADDVAKFITSGIIVLSSTNTDEELELASYIIAQKLVYGIKKYAYSFNLCIRGIGKGIIYLTLHGMTEKHLAHYKDPYVYNFIKESLFSGAWDAALDIYNSIEMAESIASNILKGMTMEQERVNAIISKF